MSSFGSSKLFDFSSGTSNFYAQQASSVWSPPILALHNGFKISTK